MKRQVEENRSDIEEMKEALRNKTTYAEALKGVEQETGSIKREMESMKNEMRKVENKSRVSTLTASGSLSVEPAISEMQERERRACNLLLFGVPEKREDVREIRHEKERQVVAGLIKQLDRDTPVDGLRFHRIGRFDDGKVRPVKVIFPTKEAAVRVLRLKNKLPAGNIYIKYDQTPAQREFLKGLMRELQQRKEGGEDDLRVRYRNGVPRIIKQRQPVPAPKN